MQLKPALSAIEQVKLLKQRGMVIKNPSAVEAFLLQNNYYRLNIYFHKFMQPDNFFKAGTTFDDIATIYLFDRWLRNRLLTLLEPIEIHIKTRVAYHLSRKYGADCFYQNSRFKGKAIFAKVVKDFENERVRNFQDPIVIHHEAVYQGVYPLWVIVEFISFRAISNLFACMQEGDKKQVAKDVYGMNDHYLGQWLHSLSVLRNICAHYGYLFRREFTVRPKLYREFGWDIGDNGHLFAMCLILKRISEKAVWQRFTDAVDKNAHVLSPFSLADYGFPEDWTRYIRD